VLIAAIFAEFLAVLHSYYKRAARSTWAR